jgi:DNA-binding MarR family transcriptional regulator
MDLGMKNFSAKEQAHLAALVRALEPLQSQMGLPQLLALCRIAVDPGLSVNDLAERLNCPQQSASRYVSALLGRYERLDAGSGETDVGTKFEPLIMQEISQNDPRKRALFVSEQGYDVLKNVLLQMSLGARQ